MRKSRFGTEQVIGFIKQAAKVPHAGHLAPPQARTLD